MNTRKKNANQYRLQRLGPEQDGEDPGQPQQQREVAQERDRHGIVISRPEHAMPSRSTPRQTPARTGTGPRCTTWLAK